MHRFFSILIVLAALLPGAFTGCMSLPKSPFASDSPEPENDSAMSLARLSERHGQEDKAFAVYTALATKEPNNPLVHHRLGVLLSRQGRLKEGEAKFNQAISLAEPSAELLSDAGYNLYLQDRFNEAQRRFQQAINADPQYKAARGNLALVLGEQGNFDASLAEFRKVVTEPEAIANVSYLKAQHGDADSAIAGYHKALDMNADLRVAAEGLAQLASRTGHAIDPVRTMPMPNRQQPPQTPNVQLVSNQPPQSATARTATPRPVQPAPSNNNNFPAQPVAYSPAPQTNHAKQFVQAANFETSPNQSRAVQAQGGGRIPDAGVKSPANGFKPAQTANAEANASANQQPAPIVSTNDFVASPKVPSPEFPISTPAPIVDASEHAAAKYATSGNKLTDGTAAAIQAADFRPGSNAPAHLHQSAAPIVPTPELPDSGFNTWAR